jgi:hypothetical protein
VSGTLTQHSGSGTVPALGVLGYLWVVFAAPTSSAINFTMRFAGFQAEQAAAASAYQLTPTAYVLAKGGGAPSGTTGGAATDVGNSFGLARFKGGGGAARASGGGGGGAAGVDGAGGTSTTATGGTGDNTHGGAANTSNVEGGGGGTAGNPAGTPGDPGGGGGANTSTGSGSTGGRGQVRLTYTPFQYHSIAQSAPIMAQ